MSFDYDHSRYMVSCWQNGRIVAIDINGVQTPFRVGLGTALGNVIYNNTIYVSSCTTVWGFGLETALPVFSTTVPGSPIWMAIANRIAEDIFLRRECLLSSARLSQKGEVC